MKPKEPQFRESTLYSETYEDIYYNPNDGLAESTHVFLEGVELAGTLGGLKTATLVETGFGTGLNFLLTAKLLEEMGNQKPFLYSSIEGFPLSRETLAQVYENELFKPLKTQCKRLLELYPAEPKIGETLELAFSANLTLQILLYSVEMALENLPESVNYWYLDGFSPKTNPEMWSPELFRAIGNHSASGSKLATFTASRLVKDGLDLAGFQWERLKGFGNKRHRLIGISHSSL